MQRKVGFNPGVNLYFKICAVGAIGSVYNARHAFASVSSAVQSMDIWRYWRMSCGSDWYYYHILDCKVLLVTRHDSCKS